MKEGFAVTGWFIVVLAGVVAPVVILILMAMTPNTVLRSGAAGRFVASNASAGGFMAPNISTVQTTTGSIAVYNMFSATRNEVLVVQRTLKDGLRLCAEGKPDTCVGLAGTWAGDMQPVPHVHHRFAGLVTGVGSGPAWLWLLMGIASSIVATGLAVQLTDTGEPKRKRKRKSKAKQVT